MLDLTENVKLEYSTLRTEILQLVVLHNRLHLAVETVTVSLLVLAETINHPLLYLMPLAILAPAVLRIAHYRLNMAKLSAYIIVFVEPLMPYLQWETVNARFSCCKVGRGFLWSVFDYLRYLDVPLLGAVCIALYMWEVLNDGSILSAGVLITAAIFWFLALGGAIAASLTEYRKRSLIRAWSSFHQEHCAAAERRMGNAGRRS